MFPWAENGLFVLATLLLSVKVLPSAFSSQGLILSHLNKACRGKELNATSHRGKAGVKGILFASKTQREMKE